MSYATGQPVPWPDPPHWANGIRESLTWRTDYMQARSGPTQKRELMAEPRRSFSFQCLCERDDRRLLDALLFDQGGKLWALPIWHDIQLLATPATSGSASITCRTAGFEFIAGGRAMLWASRNSFELVTIDTVGGTSLTLTGTLSASWPAGTRLYPVVNARNLEASEEAAKNDELGVRRVSFEVDEPCAWPAVLPATMYRGYPMLEGRTDENDDPTNSYARQIQSVDGGIGGVTYFDYVNAPFPGSSYSFMAGNRTENAALRSLLYGLAGRFATLWIPSMRSQLVLASSIAAGSVSLVVTWAGYTLFGRQQSNRRDIRIELRNGTVLYRRINGSVEGSGIETLTLDSAPGVDIDPDDVVLICFMTLSEGGSDKVELDHVTDADGITRCALQFQGVIHEL